MMYYLDFSTKIAFEVNTKILQYISVIKLLLFQCMLPELSCIVLIFIVVYMSMDRNIKKAGGWVGDRWIDRVKPGLINCFELTRKSFIS